MIESSPAADNSTKTASGRRFITPLTLMFLAITLLVLLFFGIFSLYIYNDISKQIHNQLHYINHTLTQSTRSTLLGNETILRLVGEQLFQAGVLQNPENGRKILHQTATTNRSMAGFGVIRPDGQLLLISGIPAGKQLPNLANSTLHYPDFLRTLKTDVLQTGIPYLMPQLQQWVIPMRVAIRDKESNIQLVMAAGYDINGSNTVWSDMALPKEMTVSIIRGDGYLQYSYPLSPGKNSDDVYRAVYSQPIMQPVQQQLLQNIETTDVITLIPNQLLPASLAAYEYMPEYDLYTVTSYPLRSVRKQIFDGLTIPFLLMLLYLTITLIIFLISTKQQQRMSAQLLHQLNHDQLTDLPNRHQLHEQLEWSLAANRSASTKTVVIFIDIDHFTKINDSFGHKWGDKILQVITQRLLQPVDCNHTVARISADEFVLLLPEVEQSAIEAIIAAFRSRFQEPFVIKQNQVFINASFGISSYPDDGDSAEQIYRNADIALHRAKELGRNTYCFYNTELNQQLNRHNTLERNLRNALQQGEIHVVYQPKIDAHSGLMCGVEALARWQSAQLGFVSPVEFIPIAENYGLIDQLTEYILLTSMQDIAGYMQQHGEKLSLSVNVSATQFQHESVIPMISEALAKSGFAASNLIIEVTESLFMDNLDAVQQKLSQIRAMGIGISIDDFGTGYSSLSYLHSLPATELKIDRSFVNAIIDQRDRLQLVQSIIALGHNFNLKVVAEGVETRKHVTMLQQLQCDILQGYYFSKPVAIDQLPEQQQLITALAV